MRCASSARCSPATTGAGARPASSRRCGRSACAGLSPAAATTCTTSRARRSRPSAEQEHRYWYQYYFCTPRGEAGLTQNRRGIARLLWTLWSPNWRFDDATFEATAASFDNPDFVEVVIHSYRVRYGYVPGDPALAAIEQKLAAQPTITVPTIVLQGEAPGTCRRTRRSRMRGISPGHTGAAPSRASATTCHRKRRARPRRRCWNSSAGMNSPRHVAAQQLHKSDKRILSFKSSSTN